MNVYAVLFCFVVGLLILTLPRKWAALPLIVGANYMTLGPCLEIGPFSFTVIRILILVGLSRVIMKGERIVGKYHAVDITMWFWAFAAVCSSFAHEKVASSLVFRLGMVYNGLGLYFLLRIFLQDMEDVWRVSKMVLIALVPVAIEMMSESVTGRNGFSFLGGVPEICEIRGGKIRAQGPYAHSILAGTVGAVCLPLAIGLWQRSRKLALMGLAATVAIIICSRSSGPIMAAFFALLGVALWRVRQQMRLIRWSIAIGIVALAVVMNAPVYFVAYRIDFTGSSTGWHRAILIQAAIEHFGDWWLGGTDYTRDWTPNSGYSDSETDITNHYIRMAVWGGLPMLLFFVGILTLALQRVGKALRAGAEGLPSNQFMIWTLGSALFAHAATMMSVSYFDQSVFFLYLVLASIGSLSVGHDVIPPFAYQECASRVNPWDRSPSLS